MDRAIECSSKAMLSGMHGYSERVILPVGAA